MYAVRRFMNAAVIRAVWLTPGRARAYSEIFGLFGWALFLLMLLQPYWNTRQASGPPFGDFISFWAASKQVLTGHLADVYNASKHHLVELAEFPELSFGDVAFFYPPTFLLTCIPLALLPVRLSASVWLAGAGIAFVCAIRRILPQSWALLPIVAFPGAVVDVTNGQNGLLTGALLGWGAVLLPRRPFMAGLCLGCLVIKPQMLVAAPVVLLCARQWKAVAGGMVSGTGLIGASWLGFGSGAWAGFFRMSHSARETFERGYVSFWKMQSVFTSVRLLHGGVVVAYIVQITATVLVLAMVGWACFRVTQRKASLRFQGECAPEIILMITALPFCTPFLLDYDLACLAFPVAWLLVQARGSDWLPGEKFILFLTYIYLFGTRLMGLMTHICPTPVIASALLLLVMRRVLPDEFAKAGARLATVFRRGDSLAGLK